MSSGLNFTNYDLLDLGADPTLIYDFGNGVLHEIARAFDHELSSIPSPASLFELIRKVGPAKTLQDNIDHVVATLSAKGLNPVQTTGQWLERMAAMEPLNGAFRNPSIARPGWVNLMTWPGGVANWQLRRMELAKTVNPKSVAQVILPTGNRPMGASEHQLVGDYIDLHQTQPTEADFAELHVLPNIEAAGHRHAKVLRAPTGNGDAVLDALFAEYGYFLDGTILMVGNAPNAIQAAAQLLTAARKVNPRFDTYTEPQLYVVSDSFPIAWNGEHKSVAQNPMSAAGQIVRNAALLLQAALQYLRQRNIDLGN